MTETYTEFLKRQFEDTYRAEERYCKEIAAGLKPEGPRPIPYGMEEYRVRFEDAGLEREYYEIIERVSAEENPTEPKS